MHAALLAPEIPHNAGAIGRTCAVTGSVLHLIKPLGFLLDEKHLKRSGLDYWHLLDVRLHNDYFDFIEYFNKNLPESKIYYATTKAPRSYADINYSMDDCILFGPESAGIPEDILKNNLDRCVRVPMAEGFRSLNLSVSAGIILYEAMRQNGFPGMSGQGKFSYE